MKHLIVAALFMGCQELSDEDFNSTKLVSSQNETIYINTVNWGVTGDKQRTIITKHENRLKVDDDTTGTIDGLTPFIYSFENDTLRLYFNGRVSYRIKEELETITVVYVKMENPEFMKLARLAMKNDGYHFAPMTRQVQDASIPKPPN